MQEGNIFLESYQGQSVEELLQLQDTHRIDSLVLALESALDSRKDAGLELSMVELTVLAIEAFERAVNNGGFSQFFDNTSVEYAAVIVDSLNRINCLKLATLAQQAIDLIGVSPSDLVAVEARMDSDDEALEKALNELDDLVDESDEVPAYALFHYVKKHRQSIILN